MVQSSGRIRSTALSVVFTTPNSYGKCISGIMKARCERSTLPYPVRKISKAAKHVICLVQGTQVEGLRAGDNCPFDECDEPYRDYTGWFLHCKEKHAKYIPKGGGYVPTTLKSEDRARMPMFRCTTCMASIPIGQVFRHHAQCLASLLPETVGGCTSQQRYH